MNDLKILIDSVIKEIDLYSKLLIQNQTILNERKNMDWEVLTQKMYNKNKLMEEIEKIDNKLNNYWQNWENYKNNLNGTDKEKIRKLRKLIEDNLEIENIIIKEFETLLSKHKEKTINFNQGKKAFNAYRNKKTNIPYFINQKG